MKNFIEKVLFDIYNGINVNYELDTKQVLAEGSANKPILRLFSTYKDHCKTDFLGHLRQVCVFFNISIKVPKDVAEWIKKDGDQFELLFNTNDNTVSAKPYVINDIDDLRHNYKFVKRRTNEPSFPDAALTNIFHYPSYTSLQQKMMIQIMKEMEFGSTLLASIPTGGGKSLLWQYAVATGKFENTTIVIVPTNALGTDHVQSDKEALKNVPWVQSYSYSSTQFAGNQSKIDALCEKIKDSSPFILYISPEGLTNRTIKNAVLDAAKQEHLSAIVIDEAHLVVDWGMKFRPEFQLLPGLLKQIKVNSKNHLYTVLLSATITDSDKDILLNLFADEIVYEYHGESLRPEINYYRHYCKTEYDRRNVLLALLNVVPKPVIVYVGTVRGSEIYESLIRKNGYKRVARFNGDTGDHEREKIIKQWRNDEIDIMVATSAFGMGVDKADVRTVITAYTPENISRYYQEVGRAGRDGYAALNFTLYCPKEDAGLVSSNTDKKLISTDNLWKRWNALRSQAKASDIIEERDCLILDTDSKHDGLAYELTGGYNSGWNDNVISMLVRAGCISIEDVWRKANSNNHSAYKIKVRIKNVDICYEEERYKEKIEEFREEERQQIVDGKEAVKDLLTSDLFGCYANSFVMEFPYASKVCSGCPFCRENEIDPYAEETYSWLMTNKIAHHTKYFTFRNLASVETSHKSVSMIGYEGKLSLADQRKLIKKLMIAEANLFVLDTTNELNIDDYSWYEKRNLLILSIDEVNRIKGFDINGTVVFILSDNEEKNKSMLKMSKKYIKRRLNVNQIIVAPVDYYYAEENRKLQDYVETVRLLNVILMEEDIC